ncbi:MAG: nickel pincer cofactor biosynthesis protein LarB [bacterium]
MVVPNWLTDLLEAVRQGEVSPAEAAERLRHLPSEDLGFATVDHHRQLRQGCPEVVFCAKKRVEDSLAIICSLRDQGAPILATRANRELFDRVHSVYPDAVFYERSGAITVPGADPAPESRGNVLVISAGTSDIPISEEAVVTARFLGSNVKEAVDVGVAGIHRLFQRMPLLHEANVIVVVAGMEGALASVVGGLVEVPVIGVPTSVGYGASYGGLAALLGMLNSCSSGVLVVNIDNGFGAGFAAHRINVGRPHSCADV